MDPETLPPEKGLPSQEKSSDQDVDHSTNAENLPCTEEVDPEVALKKAKLHQYLETKGLLYQMPGESKKESDPQSLEAILTEYTALDILDENNKFICNTCAKSRKLMF